MSKQCRHIEKVTFFVVLNCYNEILPFSRYMQYVNVLHISYTYLNDMYRFCYYLYACNTPIGQVPIALVSCDARKSRKSISLALLFPSGGWLR
jgi:hypothetical protein